MYTAKQIAAALDLTVVRPTAGITSVLEACELAKEYGVCAVCVTPIYVQLAVEQGVRVCSVVGFPHGTSTPTQKRDEAAAMIDAGAVELDVVINYGRFLDGDGVTVERELTAILDLAHNRSDPVVVKAILETCFYSTPALEASSKFCAELGVNFIKTSSGYGLHGATPSAVRTMLEAVRGTPTQVKASGGITCYNDAAKFLDLGCTRLGASRFKELLP